MSWFKSFINWITPPPKEVDEVAKAKVIKKAVKEGTVKLDKFNTPIVQKPQRARTKKGTFVADDKSTPDVNEAWTTKRVKKTSKK